MKSVRTKLFVSAIALMAIAFVLGTILYTSGATTSRVLEGESSHSPTAGSPEAKVHIVEFLDPACEACRDF